MKRKEQRNMKIFLKFSKSLFL